MRKPSGVVVRLPEFLVVPSPATRAQALPSSFFVVAWPVRSPETGTDRRLHRPELLRSGWPPQGSQRTGVAEVLRSSHAILI